MGQEIAVREPGIIVSSEDMERLVTAWLSSGDFADLSDDTKAAYRVSLRKFLDWLRENRFPGEPVGAGHVRAFRDSHDKAATANLRLTALRQFYTWAVEQGYTADNPAVTVKGKRRRGVTKAHKRDALTNGEVLAVLATCDANAVEGTRDSAILHLMAYTALRTVEVHRANIEDLRTKDERLVLFVQGKGFDDKDDFVVLPEKAEAAVRAWLTVRPGKPEGPLFVSLSNRNAGHRLSRTAIRMMVLRRYRQAGVVGAGETKSTHSLRHSAITKVITKGATLLEAQRLARHASADTTLVYYHEQDRTGNPVEDLISYD